MVGIHPVTNFVETDAGLGPVAVRGALEDGIRAVLVVPADHPDEFAFAPVPRERQPVWLRRAETQFARLTGADPFRPDIANEAFRKKSELARRIIGAKIERHALRPETVLVQRHAVGARRQVGVDTSSG